MRYIAIYFVLAELMVLAISCECWYPTASFTEVTAKYGNNDPEGLGFLISMTELARSG